MKGKHEVSGRYTHAYTHTQSWVGDVTELTPTDIETEILLSTLSNQIRAARRREHSNTHTAK